MNYKVPISFDSDSYTSPNKTANFTLGVPFPIGTVADTQCLSIVDQSGRKLPLQTKPLLEWPDGTCKWALLDWVGAASNVEVCVAEQGTINSNPDYDGCSLRVEQTTNALQVCSTWGTSEWRIGGTLPTFDLTVCAQCGQTLAPVIEDVEMVDEGPLRVRIRVSGSFDDPAFAFLKWSADGQFFAAQQLQRWSVALLNSRPAVHAGGIWGLGDCGSVYLKEVSLVMRPADSASTAVLSPAPGANLQAGSRLKLEQHSSGGNRWNSSNHVDRHGIVPLSHAGYRLLIDDVPQDGDRADPVIALRRGDTSVLAIYPERFWQNFPKSCEATTNELTYGLFPGTEAGFHELQGGERKTHHFWIGAAESASLEVIGALRNRPIPRISGKSFADSGVVPYLTPIASGEDPRYRRIVSQATSGPASFLAKREVIDEYGWRHYGDVYGDHEAAFSAPEPPLVSHWNNQYDLVFGLGIRYLLGEGGAWRALMEDMAWHVTDIDIYHTDDDKPAYNHGLFWHTVHYVDAGKANHRSYPQGTVGGGPCSEHAYARGLLLYYCITGDPNIADTVAELGDWVLAMEDGRRTPFRWLCKGPTGLSSASGSTRYHGPGRGPGNATETLLAAYELTGHRKYLDRVELLMKRVVHPMDDFNELNLSDAERKWFYTLYLQALGRYLEVKINLGELDDNYDYGRQTLLRYARWMCIHEYPYLEKPEILEFPTETWTAQDMRKSEVFNYAARHADPKSKMVFLEKARFFYEYSVSNLVDCETSHYCRPLALLLGCGITFQSLQIARSAPPPRMTNKSWPEKRRFVPQKVKAFRRIKLVAAAVVATGVAILILALRTR